MSVRHALLAILDQAPCYGNQLRSEYDRRTGARWPLNVGQIYTTLDRLERDHQVRSAHRDEQGHVLFEITDVGRREVALWFAQPLDSPVGNRDDLATKVALAISLAGVDPLAVVAAQRAAATVRVAQLRALRPPSDGVDLSAEVILEAQIGTAEAELKWLSLVERRLGEAGAAEGVLPLDTRIPRRGRPKNVRQSD